MTEASQTQEATREPPSIAKELNSWSADEGESWHNEPNDAQIIESIFGSDQPVVGDEYELTAGYSNVTARYRITWVSKEGDCEVECISHPQANAACPSKFTV